MAEPRKTARKAAPPTPQPDSQAAAPRKGPIPLGSSARGEMSAEETRRQIAEAAYYRAKERGFEPGHELEDWIEAESEIMGRINEKDR